MIQYLFVGLGGGLGSVMRYFCSNITPEFSAGSKFPFATLFVNLLGSFLIGALFSLGSRLDALNPNFRLFLMTGVLGGFTTFSAFSLEALLLLKNGHFLMAFTYLSCSIIFGLFLAFVGLKLFL